MDIADLILVGIGVAQRWPEIDLAQMTIQAVPKGTREWVAVMYTPRSLSLFDHEPAALAYFGREKVRLERFRLGDGEIWIGYGPQSKHLVFCMS